MSQVNQILALSVHQPALDLLLMSPRSTFDGGAARSLSRSSDARFDLVILQDEHSFQRRARGLFGCRSKNDLRRARGSFAADNFSERSFRAPLRSKDSGGHSSMDATKALYEHSVASAREPPPRHRVRRRMPKPRRAASRWRRAFSIERAGGFRRRARICRSRTPDARNRCRQIPGSFVIDWRRRSVDVETDAVSNSGGAKPVHVSISSDLEQ